MITKNQQQRQVNPSSCAKLSEEGRLAAPGVWETALELLGDCRGKKILDAPAGKGLLTEELKKRGGVPVPVDIAVPEGRADFVRADLNKALSFPDGHFDIVLCLEGIEHVENPLALLREFYRVLVPGGVLILSTPNVLNIRSRVKFLLTGTFFWFDYYGAKKFGHITPLTVFQLNYFCGQTGFKPLNISVSRRIIAQLFLSPVFKLFGLVRGESYNATDILAGEILIIKTEKPGFHSQPCLT